MQNEISILQGWSSNSELYFAYHEQKVSEPSSGADFMVSSAWDDRRRFEKIHRREKLSAAWNGTQKI